MALILADRVKETTTTIGTGNVTLLGAVFGFQSFNTAIPSGSETYYVIASAITGEWEVGIGTYTVSGTTLSRDIVLSSSNAGALVVFSAGTKDVWIDYPSNKAVTTDTLAFPPAIGGTTPNAATFTSVTIPTTTGSAVLLPNTSITSWLYSGKSKSIGAEETAPAGLFFSPDGLKMYIVGTTGDDVNEYTLGTAWDITTATFVTVFSVVAQDTGPNDVFFKPDGLTMYVLGSITDVVYQYTLGTAWSVATASYASISFSVTTQETGPTGLWFKPDGTVMYVIGSTADTVFQYTLSVAWDISTATYSTLSYSVTAQDSAPQQVNLSADGTKMYVLGSTGDDIWEYALGTAWNVSTATPVNNFYVGFQDIGPQGMFIDDSGANRVFIVGSGTDTVYQYNTATNALDIVAGSVNATGILSTDGNFVAGANAYVDGNVIVQGTLTAPGAASLGSLSVGTTTVTGTLTSSSTTTLATSTGAQTISLGAGATTTGLLKTLNIGTAGLSGSTTAINFGSAVAGSTSTITANGTWTYANTISGTINRATNLANGSLGQIPYQSAANTTVFLAAGTAGQVLQANGVAAPSWVTPAGGSGGAQGFITQYQGPSSPPTINSFSIALI